MTTAFKDLSGLRFGNWQALARAPNKGVRTAWHCKCDCGTERAVASVHLVNGASLSCGCIKSDIPTARRTHGASETDVYSIWLQMISRCHKPNNASFSNYGARGVTVCERWRSDFSAFLEDVGTRPSPKHTIDRIDGAGNYEPSNVRWATSKVQANNTRRNHIVVVRGESMTLAQAVERFGGNYGTVKWRINAKKMTAEEALGL